MGEFRRRLKLAGNCRQKGCQKSGVTGYHGGLQEAVIAGGCCCLGHHW